MVSQWSEAEKGGKREEEKFFSRDIIIVSLPVCYVVNF